MEVRGQLHDRPQLRAEINGRILCMVVKKDFPVLARYEIMFVQTVTKSLYSLTCSPVIYIRSELKCITLYICSIIFIFNCCEAFHPK